jgi:hypothetical protein
MAQKVNLNKLKEEIDTRKKERNTVSSDLGEKVGVGVAPRDVFLHGLLESVKTGRETAATSLIKTVTNSAAKKKGDKPAHTISEAPVHTPNRTVEMSPERDEQLFRDLEAKKNQTLAESIENFSGPKNTGAPRGGTVNFNGQQFLTEVPAGTGVQHAGGQVSINEEVLVNSVKKIVNNHLVENLSPVLEEAIQSTIIEMYAVERIKEVLTENRELLKEVVYEVIREIKNKSAAKS